jgi:V/A-type H+-transporting ATPase subunit E
MSNELETLLQRLQRDGVEAGKQQAGALVQAARQEAERIVDLARAEAAQLVATARAESDALLLRSGQALRHACRDLLLVVGQRIETLVQKLVGDRVGAALDTATVVRLVQTLIQAFVAHGRGAAALEVVVGPEQQKALTQAVLDDLRKALQSGITLRVQEGVGPGFQVRMGDGGVRHDFTAPAIAAALAELVTPQLAAVVLDVAVDAGKQP